MCGIVGYIGTKNATPIILNGLKKLEYRGYDSAGIAVLDSNHEIQVRREAGKMDRLLKSVQQEPVFGQTGIGHTRWATHGIPNETNAHPHLSASGKVVLVHNGIVENFLELKSELQKSGVAFNSETDTETIVQLVDQEINNGNDLVTSTRKVLSRLEGAQGIVLFSSLEPDKIIAARIGNAGGIVIGFGETETYIASDIPAILEYTRRIVFLESCQYAVIRSDHVEIYNFDGSSVALKPQEISWDPVSAEKGLYRHFMQKEIHEQVRALTDSMSGRVNFQKNRITLPDIDIDAKKLSEIKKIYITACGTAAYAGMAGKMILERLTGIPVEVEIASEFRYRDPIIDDKTIVLAISQSGETADTLAAMEVAQMKGAILWSIVNAIGSQAMRVADGFISMQAGPEIGVASTKAFTAPLLNQYMLGIYLGKMNGYLSDEQVSVLVQDMRFVPELVGHCLQKDDDVSSVAVKYRDVGDMLFIGRGINMPIAYEGALKMKEISYTRIPRPQISQIAEFG